jgi:hypothetical protein
MVLGEVATEIVGFEREPTFVAEARRLLPQFVFHQVEALSSLQASSGSFDFVMSFTVLQHIGDAETRQVVSELKRLAEGGFVLLTEETDASFMDGVEGGGVTKGRAVTTYQDWMKPFELILQFPRQIEPGYPRADVGTYMLFDGSAGRV